MLSLVLLFFAGKAYYNLAGEYGKSEWGYGILGVASYFLGLMLAAFGIGIVYGLLEKDFEEANDTLLGLMATPFGVLTCWGLYQYLKSHWAKQTTYNAPDDVLDGGMLKDEPSSYPEQPIN